MSETMDRLEELLTISKRGAAITNTGTSYVKSGASYGKGVDRKQAAVRLVVAGQIETAYQKYVDSGGRHHNPFFPASLSALQEAMIENHVQFPSKRLTVKNVLGDGDLVAVHSHIALRPGEKGIVAVHLVRFHGDKIVEMWDCGQPVPTDSPNSDGVF